MERDVQKDFSEHLQKRGYRQTDQRKAIVDVIYSKGEHFNTEDLFNLLKQKGLRASRATVYRTLALLCEAGLLREIDLGDDITTYDPNFLENPTHNHLVCIDCHRVLEFEDDNIRHMNDCLSRRLGFRPITHSLRIEAACDQLRTKGNCPHLISKRLEAKPLRHKKRP